MQVCGPTAARRRLIGEDAAGGFDEVEARLAPRYAWNRAISIYGGSIEVQRNIIAKMSLGL